MAGGGRTGPVRCPPAPSPCNWPRSPAGVAGRGAARQARKPSPARRARRSAPPGPSCPGWPSAASDRRRTVAATRPVHRGRRTSAAPGQASRHSAATGRPGAWPRGPASSPPGSKGSRGYRPSRHRRSGPPRANRPSGGPVADRPRGAILPSPPGRQRTVRWPRRPWPARNWKARRPNGRWVPAGPTTRGGRSGKRKARGENRS